MKILILTGGNSSERKISFLSAENVKAALKQNNHIVTIYDLRDGYSQIETMAKDYDILFPVLHGEEGEGGKLHKYISNLKKPIVGGRNYKDFKKAWYKISFKKFCDRNNILTPKWTIINSFSEINKFGYPCVLKTSSGGSSREVIILKSKKDLKTKKVKILFDLKLPMYVEQYEKGVEVTCGLLNGLALPLLEIVPPKGSWFNYKNKYDNSSKEIPFAPSLDKKLQEEIQNISTKIYNSFDLGSYCRIDFIVVDRNPFVLELNTIPGMTKGSLLPKQAAAAGINFNKFVEILIKSAK